MKKESVLLHAGYEDKASHSAQVPIFQTSSYIFDSPDHASNLFSLKDSGFIYTRIGNPTQDILEKRIAALHDGSASLAVSSGQTANSFAIMNLAKKGDNIVSSKYIYGGTYNLFKYSFEKLGIEVRFVDFANRDEFKKATDAKTKAYFTETIGNPFNNVDDFNLISDFAHSFGIPLIIDNTVAPYIFNPFEIGADIITYSTTKFITGNGTSIGGIIIEKGDFPWDNGKFEEFTEKDPSYHGISYWESFGLHANKNHKGSAFITKIRLQLLRDIGAAISPFNAFITLLGLETLPLRMEKHCENAMKVAEFLKNHHKIEWVNYPGLETHNSYFRAKRFLQGKYGAVVSFGVNGGFKSAKKLIESVNMILHLANIGDSRTLIIHPASTTHSQLSFDEMKQVNISENFIRLSVGIEHIEDILTDLDNALKKV